MEKDKVEAQPPQLKTIKIKTFDYQKGWIDKDYVPVTERIGFFRKSEDYKGWGLTSEIYHMDTSHVVMKATITNPEGRVIATGHASETRQQNTINQTSYLENCETSAWGRALASLGIGIDYDIASVEEMVAALSEQQKPKNAGDYEMPKEDQPSPYEAVASVQEEPAAKPSDEKKTAPKRSIKRKGGVKVSVEDKQGKSHDFDTVKDALIHFDLFTSRISSKEGIRKLERNGFKVTEKED